MRRAVLVSYYFPPRFSIGGKRAHRFAKYLPDHGWETVVLTANAPESERLDPSFTDADLPRCKVSRGYLSPRELKKIARRELGSDGTIAAPAQAWKLPNHQSAFARIRNELRSAPVIGPDASIIPALSNRVMTLAQEERADVIIASGPPWEALVASVIAAKRLRLPVVVELRDPWSFGPVAARRPAWNRAANRLAERAVLRAATAAVVTTEATREEYASLSACDRVVCIRSGFDDGIRVEPRKSEAVTFIHFGNCYGVRSLGPFLRALSSVIRRRGLSPRQARLLNLGRITDTDRSLADELGIAPFFEHSTVLPYTEGIGIVAGADLALLPSFGQEPWFIPGKLFDYLLAGTPILAASASPEIERILAETRLGFAHADDDIEAIARRMTDAIDARASGAKIASGDAAAIASMSARGTAARLASLLDEVTLARRPS